MAPRRGRAVRRNEKLFTHFNEQSLQIQDMVLQRFLCLKSQKKTLRGPAVCKCWYSPWTLWVFDFNLYLPVFILVCLSAQLCGYTCVCVHVRTVEVRLLDKRFSADCGRGSQWLLKDSFTLTNRHAHFSSLGLCFIMFNIWPSFACNSNKRDAFVNYYIVHMTKINCCKHKSWVVHGNNSWVVHVRTEMNK